MQSQLISEKQDLTYLSWTKIRHSSGTAGSFLKAYSDLSGKRIYYKLSNYDSFLGITGHECINEIIADRLLTLLGIDHLRYQLIHADIRIEDRLYETWLCASEDFKKPGESKLALDVYYQAERRSMETPMEFCIRQGWESYLYEMLVFDYLILNRDRHGANIEVLRNSRTRSFRLAPLFDHGLSLLFPCRTEEAVRKAEVMEDKPVQCFVGSNSAYRNLSLIPPDRLPALHPLRITDRDFLLEGLEAALSDVWLDKIWEMIWNRWCGYEDFCNSRRG